MNWRPTNPYKHSDGVQAWDIPEGYKEVEDEEWIAYEAGADAMLRALRAVGQEVKIEGAEDGYIRYTLEGNPLCFSPLYKLAQEQGVTKGTLVFIPSEEA